MTRKDTALVVLRLAKTAVKIALAVVAVAVVTSFSVDLGTLFPIIRRSAESAGSKRIQRPMHIGGLSIRLFDGRFVVHDLVIEGLNPGDDPFLRAKEIVVSMPLWSLLRRELVVDTVDMRDWEMKVEMFPGGRHSFPKFGSTTPSTGPSLIKTTASYVHAYRGQFTYEDHGTPWSAVVRNLDVTVIKLVGHRGHSRSSGGVVTIQRYEPMAADLNTWFRIDDGRIVFDRIELDSDGATSLLTGTVDTRRWPEMLYNIRSRLQLPRMRELFWARDRFSLSGVADFAGTFHLFKGGRELAGDFVSDEAGLNQYRFPALEGSLVWTQDRFEVTRARSAFYGGITQFTYLMAPLGRPTPAMAHFDVHYEDVDLAVFSDAMQFNGLRLAGRATGHNLLEWPLGHFPEHRGFGDVTTQPPPGVGLRGRALPDPLPEPSFAHVYGNPFPPLGHVPVGGSLNYSFGPEWIDLGPSHIATPTTYVEFQGRTAYGERSVIPFHVTSADWQDSDRLLAGIMTMFGASTRPVELGGVGTFDGVLLNAFRTPRIEGLFAAVRMRAWDVDWGSGQSRITVENAYLDVKDAVVRKGSGEMRAEGRFSLGYPRKDKGEEINARIRADQWPMVDLRHAFALDDYPVDGRVMGEFHLYGPYTRPFGFGSMTVAPGTAYGETVQSASASLRFEGSGVRFDGVEIRKGGGTVRGAAHVGWNGTYSFNTDGRQIPIEAIDALKIPQAPLSGLFEFSAGGSGLFANPEFDVRGRFRDVFIREEGVGEVTGRIGMRGDDINFEFEAASPRLAVSGTGTVNRKRQDYPGELTVRVTDTSLDPYARLFAGGLSPFATAVASGTIRVGGTLANLDGAVAQVRIDKVDLGLFDYNLHNDGAIDIGLDQSTLRLQQLRLTGNDTGLGISGAVDLKRREIGLHAEGDVDLGILQTFFGDIRSSGRTTITADVTGGFDRPQIGGSAVVSNGRLRHMWLPHAIENINGRIAFAGSSIQFNDVAATVGKGDVRFGGRVGLSGLWPAQLDVTASGESMELRFPEGFRSVVDADLALRGSMEDPQLSGTVSVRSASLKRRLDIGSGLVELAGTTVGASTPAATGPAAFPLRFDIRIVAPSTLEIDNNVARITSSADLTLRGTLDKPLLFGRAEVERGDVWFEGRRYVVTRGTVDFSNPMRIEPYFDVEAETRARAPGQTYRVTLRATGTMQRFDHELSSDPPLPEVDILSMLLGDVGSTQDAELRALRTPDRAEENLIQARAARLLASPISSNVQKIVEQTFGVDTFQITPMVVDPYQQSTRFQPGARLTIGKRISDRVYLTYSRSLTSSTRDQVIMLEYDQSDRLSWILTQNEDKTYALDVRVRHVF